MKQSNSGSLRVEAKFTDMPDGVKCDVEFDAQNVSPLAVAGFVDTVIMTCMEENPGARGEIVMRMMKHLALVAAKLPKEGGDMTPDILGKMIELARRDPSKLSDVGLRDAPYTPPAPAHSDAEAEMAWRKAQEVLGKLKPQA
jgi:hypothetical protein